MGAGLAGIATVLFGRMIAEAQDTTISDLKKKIANRDKTIAGLRGDIDRAKKIHLENVERYESIRKRLDTMDEINMKLVNQISELHAAEVGALPPGEIDPNPYA